MPLCSDKKILVKRQPAEPYPSSVEGASSVQTIRMAVRPAIVGIRTALNK